VRRGIFIPTFVPSGVISTVEAAPSTLLLQDLQAAGDAAVSAAKFVAKAAGSAVVGECTLHPQTCANKVKQWLDD
jgi:hypothetical protein